MYCLAVNGSIPWHCSYGVSLAIWDHTSEDSTHPALTSVMQAGTQFTYPGGMESWIDLHLIAPQSGVEPATFRSRVRRRTATPPRQQWSPSRWGTPCDRIRNSSGDRHTEWDSFLSVIDQALSSSLDSMFPAIHMAVDRFPVSHCDD